MHKPKEAIEESSAFFGPNASFLEELYEQFLQNPEAIPENWRENFLTLHNGTPSGLDVPHGPVKQYFADLAQASRNPTHSTKTLTEKSILKQSAVSRLIYHYRLQGHQQANTNPISPCTRTTIPDLNPANYGLYECDMDTFFGTGTLSSETKLPLKHIIHKLKEIYCGAIGCEYMHIVDTKIKRWLKYRLEILHDQRGLSSEAKINLLKQLTAAEGIEKFLHRKYVGQKRFSLDGGETLIPMIDGLIQHAGSNRIKEIVFGMAHRGRLNMLINILGKKPRELFDEFEGKTSTTNGMSGDVKYHMGFSSDVETPGGPVHLALSFNPSHLEIINPVVEGSVKARQDRYGKGSIDIVLPILIHGDAAFAGQGVVMEAFNMAETRAFNTGGTIHLVINNQIGFTTSNPFDARSTLYCTDVANMVQAPVFHVNGDDPEAALFVTRLAFDYRRTFHKDVVIDLICYRRHGHNEADEPSVTQPLMYQNIREHPTTNQIYGQKLIAEGVVTPQQAGAILDRYLESLVKDKPVSRQSFNDPDYTFGTRWQRYVETTWDCPCNTSVPSEKIRSIGQKLFEIPPGFELHSRVLRVLHNRRQMAAGILPIDWGFAENMAYATLLLENKNIRLIGQDVGRGTFFHRHAILYHQITGDSYIPLKYLARDQGRPQVFDSLLSEVGVLGFEYGYSTTEPDTLVIWEAQFGDFANCAQVVIDQFISSGEAKWGRMSGLTLLLPHGYEGQGPEHSSARLERFLQLCADHNIQVCVPSTPAQIFHLLRRQLLRPFRKPLIVMSPKSLLRHKEAVSAICDLSGGEFKPILKPTISIDLKSIIRVILCSGKIYYDLAETMHKMPQNHIDILRLEQLYPFPLQQLTKILKTYPNLKELVWCQEEPQNQGAWHQIRHRFLDLVGKEIKLSYAGRPMSAAPAVGQFSKHIEQQKSVVKTALFGKDLR